jgi:uncharacterized protein (TIGR02466 family)
MGSIELCFPTPIYYADNIISGDEINKLKSKCKEVKTICPGSKKDMWGKYVYTTIDMYDPLRDDAFLELNKKVTEHANEFAKFYTSEHNYTPSESWINIYNKDAYQEFHYHLTFTFSAVYFLSAPEGSGDLIINNPLSPDMLPPKNIKDYTNVCAMTEISYKAIENRLIIFRSNLQHRVCQGTNTEDRISLAYNF